MNRKIIFVVILVLTAVAAIVLVYMSQSLRRNYRHAVEKGLSGSNKLESSILTESDMTHLPMPVQKYLKYVGVVGREKVKNFKAIADGEIKLEPGADWSKAKVEQYNFFGDELARLFYMRIKKFGIPVYGLHSYTDESAGMLIKLAGIVTVVDEKGKEMRIGDTITLLNDMCLFAPGTLIDKRIQWETIDDLTAKAIFKTKYCTVSAILYFNDKGELINFVSDDRYYSAPDGSFKKYRWSTPVSEYREINGIRLASRGEAVWDMPQGDFCYFRFTNISEVRNNCDKFK
jgi:hypothetical protein